MVTKRTTAFAFIAILITAWLIVFVTQVEAQTTDDQKQALIGEWRGGWAYPRSYSSTLIIHEIDTKKTKTQCTYTGSEVGGKKYPILADFTPGPNPKIEFKLEGNEYKFVLNKMQLQGTFKGYDQSLGRNMNGAIKMEKYPKK